MAEGTSMDPKKLRNIQTYVNASKVMFFIGWNPDPSVTDEENIKQIHPFQFKADPVIISKEGYILDGHHRWAANKVYQDLTGKSAPMDNLIQVNLAKDDLLKEGLASPAAAVKTDIDDVLSANPDAEGKRIVYFCKSLNLGKKDEMNEIGYIDAKNQFIVNGKVVGTYEPNTTPEKGSGIYPIQQQTATKTRQTIKLSKTAWKEIGKQAGWLKESDIKRKEDMPRRKKEIDITGPDGNAFVLLGIAKSLSEQLHKDTEAILEDMKSSDYEHLIEVFDREFGSVVDIVR